MECHKCNSWCTGWCWCNSSPTQTLDMLQVVLNTATKSSSEQQTNTTETFLLLFDIQIILMTFIFSNVEYCFWNTVNLMLLHFLIKRLYLISFRENSFDIFLKYFDTSVMDKMKWFWISNRKRKILSSISIVEKLRYAQSNYPVSDLHKLHELFKCHRANFLTSK